MQYEYEPQDNERYPFKCNRGGYVFKTEQQAMTFCEMWNRHWEVCEPLNDLPWKLTREEYEAACEELGVKCRTDKECDTYGIRYGVNSPWLQKDNDGKYYPAGPTPQDALSRKLAARRLRAMEQRKDAGLDPDYPEGRRLDCGCLVFLETNVMNASLGTSCPDCYDRMSDA